MKDKARSIELLNKAVSDELLAVHQYMYFHFHLDDQGFAPLAGLFKQIAIQEMGHVEMLAGRILFLGGDVGMGIEGKVKKVTDPEKMVAKAAQMEEESARDYNQWAMEANENADASSKQIFEKLVADEEGHFDEFDKQLDHIKRFGPSYLALQSFTKMPESGGGTAE